MVRILTERIVEGNKRYIEAAALSTDSKPTGDFVNGTLYVCVDNGAEYMYNETAKEWNQTKAGYTAPDP